MRIFVVLLLLTGSVVWAGPISTGRTNLRFTRGSPGSSVSTTSIRQDLPLGLRVTGSATFNRGGTGTYAWENDLEATYQVRGSLLDVNLRAFGVSNRSTAALGAGFEATTNFGFERFNVDGPGIDLGVATSSRSSGELGTSQTDSDAIVVGPTFGIPFVLEGTLGASLALTQTTFWDSLDLDYALRRRGGGDTRTGSLELTSGKNLRFSGLAPGTYDFSLTDFDLHARNRVQLTPGLTAGYEIFLVGENSATIPLFDAVDTTSSISLTRRIPLLGGGSLFDPFVPGSDPFENWFSFTVAAPPPPIDNGTEPVPEPGTWALMLVGAAAFALRRRLR
ncbi:MAG: PEP-CTERM sorting domain-containing protein [Planctomycetota bacterium]